ncbi:hypothetical protein [Rubricoccus marinus]|uniref:Lipoprotein n=1 Tax=Rubricoccus marinus TaxID=716817 RepID=A0A259U0I8_9BACT|nr:hypothetical protein [Rubricoccus marinus]OZC03357.1 hypothetical protein BSZ36_10410 [Rubricoccus marinus]
MTSRLPIAVLLGCCVGLAACSTPSRTTGKRGDSPRQGRADTRGSGKVTICHKGRTLRVDGNAVRAHLNHGDRRGACR